jgi:xanthine dehydrogenase accessory factor
MISAGLSRRAEELAEQGRACVVATVVRAQHPTSVQAGNVALVLDDGTIDGFVGGVCAEHSVRVYSLRAIEAGEAVLLRILPDADAGLEIAADEDLDEERIATMARVLPSEEGSVTVQNPCLSGGAIEVFLEPVLPAPRVVVVGDTPIAAALRRLGAELGLELVAMSSDETGPASGDLALVVAAHGRDELHALRLGLEAGLPYVGLVASPKRGKGVIAELRADGVPEELLALIDVPAGIEIGAQSPAEIALSILAKVVAVRRGEAAADAASAGERRAARAPERPHAVAVRAPVIAVDPVCGMTVAAIPGTPSVEHDGETIYFCCEGCKAKFESEHEYAAAHE